MIEYPRLLSDLTEVGLGSWQDSIPALLNDRFVNSPHGDLPKWRAIVDALPAVEDVTLDLRSDAPGGNCAAFSQTQCASLREQLLQLHPWRKGPFNLCGVAIDAEWRSNLKWQRIADAIAPLDARTVLDVGCGNGYYALRMIGAGANLVIGIDPTLLFVCQFLAIRKLLGVDRVHVLPARLHELPLPAPLFDSTFSMGVLYHQRQPHDHLEQLLSTLRPGGELVLETLVTPGDQHAIMEPGQRYARMRNVWQLPSVPALVDWLQTAGFENVRIADVSVTTCDEQRATEWMHFDSLKEALDANDPTLTIEGLPAPMRAVAICSAP